MWLLIVLILKLYSKSSLCCDCIDFIILAFRLLAANGLEHLICKIDTIPTTKDHVCFECLKLFLLNYAVTSTYHALIYKVIILSHALYKILHVYMLVRNIIHGRVLVMRCQLESQATNWPAKYKLKLIIAVHLIRRLYM